VAQVPKEHEDDFKSVKKFNVFNTNNLWISLPAIQRLVEERALDMEIIVNPKLFGHSRSPSMEFKELTKKDAQISLAMELDKLLRTMPEGSRQVVEQDFDGFKNLFGKFINSTGPSVNWDKIEKLPQESIQPYGQLPCPESKEAVKTLLDQLVVIKLNGGLGTSMGCSGPKSVIPVRNDLTFLDLTVQQIEYLNKKYDANVPLVLMNSFNTDDDTMKIIRKYSGFKVQIKTFNQSRYPRINRESLMPVPRSCKTEDDINAWYPPGHGDFIRHLPTVVFSVFC
jgi:UTP--glucose-1-phosphate uridylyltransferase